MSKIIPALYLTVCFLLPYVFPQTSQSVELTDREKKEVVYRMYLEYKKDFPKVKDISAAEAKEKQRLGEKVLFVDVRQPQEIAVSTLLDAISKEEFLASADKYRDYIVIGYCTISYRSGLFAAELLTQGRTIYNLKGGILGWVHEGGHIFHNGKETKRLHVYGEKWNYAPSGFKTEMFSFWQRFF